MKKIVLFIAVAVVAAGILASCAICTHEELAKDAAVAPTCTETGLTEGSHCAKCGEVIVKQHVVPAKGHVPKDIEGKPATCTEAGFTAGSKCKVCGAVLSEQTEIPATGHTVVELEGKPATCTESGTIGGSFCSVCGETLSESTVIPATGHTEEVIPGKEATDTEDGLTEGIRCSVCGEILRAQEKISARLKFTKPKSAEIESFKGSARSAALNMKPFTDGNTVDPKDAVKVYYYAAIYPWVNSDVSDGWKEEDYDKIPKNLQHLMIISFVYKRSVPVSRISAFFSAGNLDFSGVSDYEFIPDSTAATYNSKTKSIDYYAAAPGMGGGWDVKDIVNSPYETTYKKNSASEYTYTVKKVL